MNHIPKVLPFALSYGWIRKNFGDKVFEVRNLVFWKPVYRGLGIKTIVIFGFSVLYYLLYTGFRAKTDFS